ncbi:TauD/TfdA family dioxygenase [Streptomyces sp. Ag109_O5-10]|uniref:TauD/TfdA family dioxygenase n=1 Tax=Streptomyces sp. Ag109_O5-10 TaxID=1855349 RepID=UPI000895A47B|nr:TauD/TfdA family dioxygenase [Streptomyces sp. Ag109_O5-10]SEF09434.1 Taurine catabolism dioxygenase TauD, TfdA family [Streptomyces sp. Ag109_O5-10]
MATEFTIPEFKISSSAVSALLTREIDAETPLDKWPTETFPTADTEIQALRGDIVSAIRKDAGGAVVRVAPEGLSDQDISTVYWNFFTLLFRPVPQYSSGELIYPVEVKAAAAATSHYSNSNKTGNYHTDGTLLPQLPDVAFLFGLSAATGGETLLMDVENLVRELDRIDPAHVAELSRPVPFDVKDQMAGVKIKRQPVLTRTDNGYELRYVRMYIEQAFAAEGTPVPPELLAAMDAFDQVSAAAAVNAEAVLLERGVGLLWDNRRMLHGRRPFQETTSHRRLRRIYGVQEDGRAN